jgi:Rod binding domain-containing protein
MEGINPGITPAIPSQGNRGTSGLSAKDALRLREAAADFESMFVKQMLTSMRKAIPKQEGGLIKESEGEKMFRDLLDAEYAKTTSRSGQGIGLGAAMYKQLVARFGLEAQGSKSGHIPTVSEARHSLNQLRQESSAYNAAGQGRVGKIAGSN